MLEDISHFVGIDFSQVDFKNLDFSTLDNVFGIILTGLAVLVFSIMAILCFIVMWICVYRRIRGIIRWLGGVRIRNDLMDCRSCGESISAVARICPYCGRDYGVYFRVRDSVLFYLYMFAAFGYGALEFIKLFVEEFLQPL